MGRILTSTNVVGSDTLANPDHTAEHTTLANKIGFGSVSGPTPNKLFIGDAVAGESSWSKQAPLGEIVGTTDTQVITNKTFGAPTTFNLPGSAPGAIFYVDGSGNMAVLPPGNNSDILNLTAGFPAWIPVGAIVTGVSSVQTKVGAVTFTSSDSSITIDTSGAPIDLLVGQPLKTTDIPAFPTVNVTTLAAGPNRTVFTDAAKLLTTTGVTGYDQGGTGQSTWNKGDILYANAINSLTRLSIGTSGQVLSVSAGGLPVWTTGGGGGGGGVTDINGTAGSIILADTSPDRITITQAPAGTFTFSLPQNIGTNSSPTFNGLALNSLSTNNPVFTDGAKNLITLASTPANKGGTGQTAYTIGDILYADTATTLAKLPAGALNQVLTSNGPAVAPSWQASGGGGGFTSGVRANKSGNQAVPLTTNTTITSWTELYDGLGEFDPVTGIFTASAAGTYLVNFFAQFNIAANSTGAIAAYITHNTNATTNNETQLQSQHTLPGITVTNVFALSPGDTLRFMCNVIGGTLAGVTLLATVASGPYNFNTYISIQRIV